MVLAAAGLALVGPGVGAAGAGSCSDTQGISVFTQPPNGRTDLVAANPTGDESGILSKPIATANDLVLNGRPINLPAPLYSYIVPHGAWPLVHEVNCDVVAKNGL